MGLDSEHAMNPSLVPMLLDDGSLKGDPIIAVLFWACVVFITFFALGSAVRLLRERRARRRVERKWNIVRGRR